MGGQHGDQWDVESMTTWGPVGCGEQHGDNLETTCGDYGDGDVETTWGQHGDNMGTTQGQC